MIPLTGIAKTVRALKGLGVQVPRVVRSTRDPLWEAYQAAGRQAPDRLPGVADPFLWNVEKIPAALQQALGLPDSLRRNFIWMPRRVEDTGVAMLRGRFRDQLPDTEAGPIALLHEVGHNLFPKFSPSHPFPRRAIQGAQDLEGRQDVNDAVIELVTDLAGDRPASRNPALVDFVGHNNRPEEIAGDAMAMSGWNRLRDRETGQLPLFDKDTMRQLALEEVLNRRHKMGDTLVAWRPGPSWRRRS